MEHGPLFKLAIIAAVKLTRWIRRRKGRRGKHERPDHHKH